MSLAANPPRPSRPRRRAGFASGSTAPIATRRRVPARPPRPAARPGRRIPRPARPRPPRPRRTSGPSSAPAGRSPAAFRATRPGPSSSRWPRPSPTPSRAVAPGRRGGDRRRQEPRLCRPRHPGRGLLGRAGRHQHAHEGIQAQLLEDLTSLQGVLPHPFRFRARQRTRQLSEQAPARGRNRRVPGRLPRLRARRRRRAIDEDRDVVRWRRSRWLERSTRVPTIARCLERSDVR